MKNKALTEYLATIGANAGKSKSPAKQAASRANDAKGKVVHPKIHTLKVSWLKEGWTITVNHEHV